MQKLLDVRPIGLLDDPQMKDDTRSPESFPFPACLTSLMETLGEDVQWETTPDHGRDWTHRQANKAYLAASGMAFGLLWHPDICQSSLDLTQVNQDHNDTIRYAFDYAGYDCDIIEKTDDNAALLRAKVALSIDAGRPVLAFGVMGPPECGIICGYDDGGETVCGWYHFQSHDPADCLPNGMFVKKNWTAGKPFADGLWKIVLCGGKKEPQTSLMPILKRGVAIMEATEIGGYLAGGAAYDAWTAYVQDPAYEGMDGEALKGKHWLHHVLVGSHAEARCYLGGFLHAQANGNPLIIKAADCFNEIHDTCWKVWGVLGGLHAPDGYLGLRDARKRAELAVLIGRIRELDRAALSSLQEALV